MILPERVQRVLWTIHTGGPMSRRDLARRLNIRANTVGDVVGRMVEQGLLCEGDSKHTGRRSEELV